MQWVLCVQLASVPHEAGTAVTTQMAISLHCSFSLCHCRSSTDCSPFRNICMELLLLPDPGIACFSPFFVPFPMVLPFLKFRGIPSLAGWLSFSLQKPTQVQSAPDHLHKDPMPIKPNSLHKRS